MGRCVWPLKFVAEIPKCFPTNNRGGLGLTDGKRGSTSWLISPKPQFCFISYLGSQIWLPRFRTFKHRYCESRHIPWFTEPSLLQMFSCGLSQRLGLTDGKRRGWGGLSCLSSALWFTPRFTEPGHKLSTEDL